tara:strand:+ start:5830 stop:6609 length:780 start_codon:yes stop_codon:yes gene_type:complete
MSETKIIYDMKDADYRAVDAYGSTVIKTAATLSVKHARTGRPDSTSLSRGRLIHALVLEPDEVDGRYAVQPAGHGNSKAVREAKAAMREAGIIPVSPSDWDACNRSADSVRNHPLAGKLLSTGKPEVSMFWTHESGAKLKSRIDWLDPEAGMAIDLKSVGTVGATHPDRFLREALRYHYAAQAAHYMDGLAACTGLTFSWRWIAVEVAPPYAVTVFDIGEGLWERGVEVWKRGIERLVEADSIEENTTWPSKVYTLDVG